jgi:hypothetical protein
MQQDNKSADASGNDDNDNNRPFWDGTEQELDELIASLHQATDCPDCRADPTNCCLSVENDASCPGHSVLTSQAVLDWVRLRGAA